MEKKKLTESESNQTTNIYKYTPYKDFVSMQEVQNYKNKYDNRQYASYRFKIWSNRVEATDEIFMKTRNTQIFAHGKIQRIRHNNLQMRLNIWYFMSWFGSNRSGEKKLYKTFHFNEQMSLKTPILAFIFGLSICFLSLSYYYNNKKHQIWLQSYGDFVPIYEKLGNNKGRYYWRKIRYYLHYWKIVSIYNFKKYDYKHFSKDTGFSTVLLLERLARYQEYHNRRDPSFDFMKLGEDDFWEFDDKLI